MKTKQYTINMPETIHTRIKLRATRQKITIKEFINRAIRHALEQPPEKI